MYDSFLLFIPLITLFAFFIKGVTGFGTALVMVPICTVLIGIHDAIVLSTILDVVAGSILYFHTPSTGCRRFMIPISTGMVTGSILGALLLSMVPMHGFELYLGFIVFILGVWFLSGRGGTDEASLPAVPPLSASALDVSVSTFSGFCGGLFGISGPPIIYYLGNRLAKKAFRQVLIFVFLIAGITRIITYLATGLVTTRSIVLALISIPALLLGIYSGHHLFIKIPERWFSRFVGLVLILSAARLLAG